MKSLASIFPHMSRSFADANPSDAVQSNVERLKAKSVRGRMNKTEAEFALMLEAQKRKGEILRYEYEGITLRWASIRYTPDFVVFEDWLREGKVIKLIEVKGPFIKGKFERAVERFRHARTYWPEFSFELWQKQKSGWKRLQ